MKNATRSKSWKRTNNSATYILYQQDCIEGMRAHLAAGSVDVIVTSPPYNLGIRYGKYDDTIPRTAYLEWLDRWALAAKQVLADDGSLFLNIGAKPTDPAVPFQVLDVLLEHFQLQNTIHWIKSITISEQDLASASRSKFEGDTSFGHYKPINSPRFLNDGHEYVFHLTKTGQVKLDRLAIGVPYQDKSNVTRWRAARDDIHCRGNTWFIPYETITSRKKDRPHPATFPVKLPMMCIRLAGTKKTRLVLDPFLGIGQTALACLELGVSFVGFEIDPNYFRESRERLARALAAHKSL